MHKALLLAVALTFAAGCSTSSGADTAATAPTTTTVAPDTVAPDTTPVVDTSPVVPDPTRPFDVFVPSSYTKGTAMPLVVLLHGYVPSYNKLRWMAIDPGLAGVLEELGCALLLPFGRGNTDFLSIGEADVLQAIEEMCRRWPIDRSRIYLAGYSMGQGSTPDRQSSPDPGGDGCRGVRRGGGCGAGSVRAGSAPVSQRQSPPLLPLP